MGRLKKEVQRTEEEGKVSYAATLGLAAMNYIEEKGKILEDEEGWPNRAAMEKQSEN